MLTNEVPDEWDSLYPHLDKAVKRGDGSITLQSTYAGLVGGTQYAVVSPYGAATVINSIDDEGEKVLLVGLLGGEKFKEWLPDFAATLVALAAWLDVQIIELQGRKGWARFLKHLGPVVEGERIRFYV